MAVPKEAVWERDPHTAAKHDLLKRFLEAWAPILLSRHDVISYAEGFAGAGVYKRGEPGSPVIAYEVFAETLHRFPKRMRVILMEEDARRVNELQHQMELVRSRQTDDIAQRMAVDIRHGAPTASNCARCRSSSVCHTLAGTRNCSLLSAKPNGRKARTFSSSKRSCPARCSSRDSSC